VATDEEKSAGKYAINFEGDVIQSQVVVGDYNTVSQKFGFSPQEVAELRGVFDDLRSAVAEKAPPEQREAALAEAAELEAAIVTDHPQPSRVHKALTWFRDNAPELVGAVLSVVASPLVGKLAEKAGEAVADQFRNLATEER